MLREGLIGLGTFGGYYLLAALSLLIIRALLKFSGELFRKLLHFVCFMSVFVLLYAFDTWYIAMTVGLLFGLVVYPAIALLERYPKLMGILEPRHNGEIKSSIVIVFFMLASLIAVFWGWLGEPWKYIILVAVMAWGFGDAAAALVGKSWGRRQIRHRWVDGAKTAEGTIAMFAVSALAMLLTLVACTQIPWYLCLGVAVLAAPVSAVVELVSHRGIDTITVPYATAAAVFALLNVLPVTGVMQ
ncbi:MAG TPA: phosphatidate cytidylyltransferase [Symbiobacteriaceae bacterium]|nr:phosphatidate cytidylyltransferase [Symbiobacteriaceae bacterium]